MNDENEIGLPEIRGMAPYLQVFDMAATLKFYRDLFGFKVVMSSGAGDNMDWLLLRLNDVELMFNAAYNKQKRPSSPDPMRATGHSDVTLYFGCPDIDTLYAYLRHKGIELEKPVITSYNWRALYLTDPDGYHLCFHWPPEND